MTLGWLEPWRAPRQRTTRPPGQESQPETPSLFLREALKGKDTGIDEETPAREGGPLLQADCTAKKKKENNLKKMDKKGPAKHTSLLGRGCSRCCGCFRQLGRKQATRSRGCGVLRRHRSRANGCLLGFAINNVTNIYIYIYIRFWFLLLDEKSSPHTDACRAESKGFGGGWGKTGERDGGEKKKKKKRKERKEKKKGLAKKLKGTVRLYFSFLSARKKKEAARRNDYSFPRPFLCELLKKRRRATQVR